MATKVPLLEKLRDSIVLIGYQYKHVDQICGTGFVLGGKYVLTTSDTYRKIIRHSAMIAPGKKLFRLFADILGKNTELSFVDNDRRRNICVFEIPERRDDIGVPVDSLAWNKDENWPEGESEETQTVQQETEAE